MSWRARYIKLAESISTRAVLFLFFFTLYVFTMSGVIMYGDEVEKYRVAQSIVERGEISFRPTAVRNIASPTGQTISLYELGQTLLQIPFYAVGYFLNTIFPTADPNQIEMLIVGLLNPLLSAFACVAMFDSGRVVGFRNRTALTVAVLYGLASIAFPYAQGYTREPLLALTLLLSVGALFQFEKTRAYRWVLMSGLAAGYLVFTKFLQAMVVPFLLIYAASVARHSARGRRAYQKMLLAMLIFLSPVLVFLIAQAIYSLARFGTVWAGYSTRVNPLAWILFLIVQSQPHVATFGLLFSPEKSFFLYTPLSVLCFGSLRIWWRQHKPQALLILALLGIEFLSVIARPDWDGGTWWGPRYLVQLTPLLILSLGFWFESSHIAASPTWRRIIAVLFGLSLVIQILGVWTNDRDFLDVTGTGITALKQLEWFRYGLWDSLFIYLSPVGFPAHVNPATWVMLLLEVILGGWLIQRWKHDVIDVNSSRRLAFGFITLVLVIELGALLLWVVAPYPRVLVAQADTRFTAAEQLFADGRVCEARALYRLALDRGTAFQSQSIARYEQIQGRRQGLALTADDLMKEIEMANGISPEKDYLTALTPEGALKLHIPGEHDATIMLVSTPLMVTPNTRYELSGWWRTLNVYGTRYASITLYQDDGNWQYRRTNDLALLDETHGWQPFHAVFTTLPTTQRVMVKVALWKTYGTVWVDDVRLVVNPDPAPACK